MRKPEGKTRILLISDKVLDLIYANSIRERLHDIDLVISCGDLPNYYLEFIVSTLNKPLFFVMGNHNPQKVYSESGLDSGEPEGCINIDSRIVEYNGLLIGGLEGSMKYSGGSYQYTEAQMNRKILKMMPRLFLNRLTRKSDYEV